MATERGVENESVVCSIYRGFYSNVKKTGLQEKG